MNHRLEANLKSISHKKALLDRVRPLSTYTHASVREKLFLEWTYHSIAIEGNTLSLRETKVLLEGISVAGRSIREHVDATNHRDAIMFVEDIASAAAPITESQIQHILALTLNGNAVDQIRLDGMGTGMLYLLVRECLFRMP